MFPFSDLQNERRVLNVRNAFALGHDNTCGSVTLYLPHHIISGPGVSLADYALPLVAGGQVNHSKCIGSTTFAIESQSCTVFEVHNLTADGRDIILPRQLQREAVIAVDA